MKYYLLLFTLAIVMSISPLIAQNKLDKKTLLTIDGDKTTVAEFMRIYQKNNINNEVIDKKSVEEYMDLFINYKLKVKEAENLKMDTSQAFIKELEGYREQLAQTYFTDESIIDKLTREAYERSKHDLRASHLLLKVDENAAPEDTLEAYNKMLRIRQEIIEGKSFSEAAVEYSEDESARDREEIPNVQRFRKGNKGDLGFFSVFDMVYPFENAAYALEINEISQAVRSQFGYHLIQLTIKQEAMGVAEVAHIYVALPPKPLAEDSTKGLEKINNIYQKIQEGMAFEQAAMQFSEDRGSSARGGKLSKFTSNRIVPEFVTTIALLDSGEISQPIQTQYGFHIIKLLDRQPPGSFDEEQLKLTEKVKKDKRSQLSKKAVINKIKTEYGFEEYPENLDSLLSLADSSWFDGSMNTDSLAQLMDGVLFKLQKTEYNQGDFLTYLNEKPDRTPNTPLEIKVYKNYKKFVDESCIDYEDARLEEKYPDFANLMQEYRDGILLFNLMDEKVWTKAIFDTTGLEAFFEANKNDYMWDERLDATIYEVSEPQKADDVKQIILEHQDAGEIAQIFINDSIDFVKINAGKFQKGDNAIIDQIEWKKGLSDKITSEISDMVYFVYVNELLAAEPKKLVETRGIVTAAYQQELEKQWMEDLHQKYKIDINTKVLEKISEAY